jgi:hypothetical protein
MNTTFDTKLFLLNQRPWQTADLLAAAGPPEGRLKQWLASGTLILADEPHPGTGQRRVYRLLDIYQTRLVTVMGERLGIGPADAIRIVNESLYAPYLIDPKQFPLSDVRYLHRLPDTWPYEYRNRDRGNPCFLMAERSLALGWKVRRGINTTTLFEAWRSFPSPGLSEHESEDVPGFVVVNLTEQLSRVDAILHARLDKTTNA